MPALDFTPEKNAETVFEILLISRVWFSPV